MAKGKKNNKKFSSKSEDFRKEYDDNSSDKRRRKAYREGPNAPAWYTGNQQLAKDAGNFSFTWPVGNPIDMEFNVTSNLPTLTLSEINNTDGESKFALPGVMSIRFVPTVGISKDNSSVVNVAAHNIYTFVRHANSGHSNYDAPDLMLYLLAMDQIYMMFSHMVRLYGTLAIYDQRNRNLPKLLVEAEGFDYDDVITHMSDLRYYINQVALKINSFAVPATMNYFTRHYQMCQHVFKDSDDPKAQLYVFIPEAYGEYKETNGAGYLSAEFFNNWSTSQRTYSDIVTIMDTLLNAVIYSEDMNIMSGDILKAYGADKLFSVPQIPAEYVVVPVHSLEALEQIHNTTLAGHPGFTNGVFVGQDPNTNALISTVQFGHWWGTGSTLKRIMSAVTTSPTPDEVLVNSRLMMTGAVSFRDASGSNYPLNRIMDTDPVSVGSEVATYATIFKYGINGVIKTYDFDNTIDVILASTNPSATSWTWMREKAQLRGILSAFNFHPCVLWNYTAYSGSLTFGNLSGLSTSIDFDVDNYAIVDEHDIEKMHETCLLSLFDVPQMGK